MTPLFNVLKQLRPNRPMTGETPKGAIWSTNGKKHVLLISELSNVVSAKLQLPMPKRDGMLLLTIDAPLGGWQLQGYQHPFGPYGYGIAVADISAERAFPKQVPQNYLDNWDGVCVLGDNVADLRFHLRRTGLFNLIKRRVEEGMIYIGANAGAILAGDDLTNLVQSPGRTRGLDLTPKIALPYSNLPEVQRALLGLNQLSGNQDRYFGISNDQVAHFRDGVLEIR